MSFNLTQVRKQLKKLTCVQPERDNDEEELVSTTTCKVLAIGDGFVGKTSLLNRFVTDSFIENYEATIFENLARPVMVGKKKVMLHLFDTAGQEDYEQLRRSTYYETDIVLLCFSVDSHQSLVNIQGKWHEEIRTFFRKVPVLLIGLKTDLRPGDGLISPEVATAPAQGTKSRTMSDIANGNAADGLDALAADSDVMQQSFSTYNEGQEIANIIGARAYFECSSKLNQGLTSIFYQAARIHERRQRSSLSSLSLSSLRNRLSSRTSLSVN